MVFWQTRARYLRARDTAETSKADIQRQNGWIAKSGQNDVIVALDSKAPVIVCV